MCIPKHFLGYPSQQKILFVEILIAHFAPPFKEVHCEYTCLFYYWTVHMHALDPSNRSNSNIVNVHKSYDLIGHVLIPITSQKLKEIEVWHTKIVYHI